ncbi:MAG: ABC transporter permease [Candidatus Bathyarchaeota archaeon]|nr:ABC transporter permease [Candidatus Bathyarchaeota archaeon]
MRSIRPLIVKEVKELVRDPKILIGVILMPLLIFPVMGSAISVSQKSVMRAIISASFAVYNEDEGPAVGALLDYLFTNNTVIPIEAESLQDALIEFQGTNATALLYIRDGYSENASRGFRGRLKIYANLKSMTIAEAGTTDTVSNLIGIYSYQLSMSKIHRLLEEAGDPSDPTAVRSPLSVSSASIIKGNVLEVPPSSIFNLIISQSVMLPIMVMVMLMFAIQMAATSIALEKEQKTLETLMTLPVGRLTILSGKLGGSIVVAVAGAISYMIGFSYYMTSAFSFAPGLTSMTTGDIGLGLQPLGMILIGVNIFVTLVSGLALAISLAVFADNVRSAQSLTGFLVIPVIIPSIILMFADLSMLPSTFQWILLAIPYTHSIIGTKAAFLGDYFVVLRSIAYIAAFTVAVLYIAARIFSTERIITARFASFSLRGLLKKR